MKQIPNLFTLLNLVFGCIAIVLILQTGESIVYIEREGFTQVNLPEKIWMGALFIFASAIVDFLDGFVARLFNASSEMGKQLDSLADAVSFGVAPGLIMYQLLRISFAQEIDGLDISIFWLLPALLIPCAAVWRLAKFNLDTEQKFHFKGVPTPAAGLLIASFPLIIYYQILGLQFYLINKWLLYMIIILVSYLMVSDFKLLSLKFKEKGLKNNIDKIILLFVSLTAIVFLQWAAIPLIFVVYIILSLALKNKIV